MRLSVLVPSYRRPADLTRCLGALSRQTRMPDQILLVIRAGDNETIAVSKQWLDCLRLAIVEVDMPGQVHALNAGLEHCSGDIVAITDDDAAPREDWLTRIEKHFESDSRLGGVGGRDWIHQNGKMDMRARTTVGRISWFGRMAGNHHLGAGPPRLVDILKGANCAFRMAAIAPIGFDTRLRGAGAQVRNDLVASLAVKRAGWRLLYDPAIAVDHFLAPRFDRDRRGQFDWVATADRAYNLHLALNEITPAWRRLAALAWQKCYGTRDEPGLVSLLLCLARRDPHAFSRFAATRAGVKGKD